MSTDLNSEIQAELSKLGNGDRQRVLDYVRTLKNPGKGTPGSTIAAFAGAISPDELQKMQAAIEMGCEQVDVNDW